MLLLQFLFVFQTFSQTKNDAVDPSSLIDFASGIYGVSNKLVNGEVYLDNSKLIAGHPFLDAPYWNTGKLHISGTTFDSVLLKYDIQIDEVILKTRINDSTFTKVVLNKSLVDSFSVHNKFFAHSRHLPFEAEEDRYCEVIHHEKMVALKTYKKEFIRKYTNSAPHGSFSSANTHKYIIINGHTHKTDRRRAFLRLFPDHRKSLRKFCRNHDINFRKANTNQLQKLFNYCEKLLTNQH